MLCSRKTFVSLLSESSASASVSVKKQELRGEVPMVLNYRGDSFVRPAIMYNHKVIPWGKTVIPVEMPQSRGDVTRLSRKCTWIKTLSSRWRCFCTGDKENLQLPTVVRSFRFLCLVAALI